MIIAGVAVATSFTQLLAHVLRTSKTLVVFYQDLKDAPSHLKQVKQRLLLLLCILEVYEAHLREIEDDRLLPPNLRMLLQIVSQRLDNEAATTSIDFLAREGVRLTRILADGKNVLHLSASIAMDIKPIKHFYESHEVIEVNQLDQCGWTPLHYAIDSPSNRRGGTCGKIRMLLEKGADPYSKGKTALFRQLHPSNMFGEPVSPIEYA